jgi:hypothetical protein
MARRVTVVAGVIILAVCGLRAGQDLTQGEADSLQRKLDTILERGSLAPSPNSTPRRTDITEREINAYFKYGSQLRIPVGIVDPRLAIPGDGHLAGRALVDLDVVRKAKARSFFDPMRYMRGTVEVKVSGTLQTADGLGTFQLESASVGGIGIPKSLLQDMVSYYSRTADNPDGFSLDKPFELPAGIRRVDIQPGAATIVQ